MSPAQRSSPHPATALPRPRPGRSWRCAVRTADLGPDPRPWRVRHRAEGELAVLEGHLDPGDPRRPVGSQGGNRLVSVPVEEPPHALSELRFPALDVLPRRHAPNISQACRPSVSVSPPTSASPLTSGPPHAAAVV